MTSSGSSAVSSQLRINYSLIVKCACFVSQYLHWFGYVLLVAIVYLPHPIGPLFLFVAAICFGFLEVVIAQALNNSAGQVEVGMGGGLGSKNNMPDTHEPKADYQRLMRRLKYASFFASFIAFLLVVNLFTKTILIVLIGMMVLQLMGLIFGFSFYSEGFFSKKIQSRVDGR